MQAMAALFEHLKLVAEPGGAAAVAAVLARKANLLGKDRGRGVLGRQCRCRAICPGDHLRAPK